MKFIKLMSVSGREFYVNVEHILQLRESDDPGFTTVVMSQMDRVNNRQKQFDVKGNMHEIATMINEGCEKE